MVKLLQPLLRQLQPLQLYMTAKTLAESNGVRKNRNWKKMHWQMRKKFLRPERLNRIVELDCEVVAEVRQWHSFCVERKLKRLSVNWNLLQTEFLRPSKQHGWREIQYLLRLDLLLCCWDWVWTGVELLLLNNMLKKKFADFLCGACLILIIIRSSLNSTVSNTW